MTETFVPDFTAPLVIGETGLNAIRQNIKIIILTFCYSIPLDRGFAHDARPPDSPGPVVTARLTSRIIDAIEKYEPRVKVDSLEWLTLPDEAQAGTFRPKITFQLKKGVKL